MLQFALLLLLRHFMMVKNHLLLKEMKKRWVLLSSRINYFRHNYRYYSIALKHTLQPV